MALYRSTMDLIGNTPLVEINAYTLPRGIRLFAKLEFMNPGGSVKDRVGKALLHEALATGKIKPGGTLVEATAGNAGIGLAMAAIHEDISVVFAVPEKFSIEKQTLMKALGARIVHTPTAKGMRGAIDKARELVEEIPGAYCPGQFTNPDNPKTYYQTMGPEIWNDLEGKVDVFVAGAGSGGTFMGTSRYLKEQNPNLKTVIVEPEGSIINGGESGSHKTEGIGMEMIPEFMDKSYFNAIHTISDEDAFNRVAELARLEGLLIGSSAGSALHAALLEAETAPDGAHIVTIFPDSSERYLSKQIYEGGI
ncbi:cysteine synthase family protein [Paenibacillus sp. PK4536]|uniref:cysteine synthase n=1 Tax=Paenibacillus nuruki TaxID=1886670 RepID=A0A1E3L201_9BACL|nr:MULTISPECIES: cysteine synthase family protein [Paenibacillus]ODP27832.1 putative cysteine synthase [Paenibacillus nuruki]TKJ89483.1 cysteine synthase family protein [Paenibacillus sp. CFBP13512]WIM38138.1 cysteine synthase family protein [Paenibacillus sp. PK4536]CAJ1315194.1 Cysteine synthase family protein [Paenibacillus nuruki]